MTVSTHRKSRRFRRTAVAAVGLLAIVAAGCTSGDDAASGSTTTAAEPLTTLVEEDPTFVEGDCWWPLAPETPAEVTITCGTVEVPEDRSVSGGRTVALPVARIHHSGGDAAAPPLLMLHGGPGGSLLDSAPVNAVKSESLKSRDTILWDQRGSGRSVPTLNCPEKEVVTVDALGAADPFEQELATNVAAIEQCRGRLEAEGIDLDQYNTLASVADIESIRRAFGAELLNLNGTSYGTRIGLAYTRAHPERVRALVIDSVYPPGVGGADRFRSAPQEAFDRLFEACAADAACNAAYPDFGTTFDAAVDALNERPETFTRSVEVGGETTERTFTLTGADLRSGMFAGLYETDLIPLIPGLVSGVANGDRAFLPTFIDMAMPRIVGLSEGAFYSVDCADSGRLLDGATPAELGGDGADSLYTLVSSQIACDPWGVEFLPESFNETVVVDTPTLVFGATLDPITPYADSVAQAEAMPNARFVSVPRGGHGVQRFDECTQQAYIGFLDDPTAPLPECTESIPPLPFSTPGA